MKEYKVDLASQFKHLWILLLYGILFPFGVYYLTIFKLGSYQQDTAFTIGGVTFFVFTFPVVLLHLNYYFKNRGDIFRCDESGRSCTYIQCGKETKFTMKEVENITCFKSWPLAENRMHIFPWDSYNYGVIQLKENDEKLYLSSLLVTELDKLLKSKKVRITKTFYPWIE